MSPPHDVFTPLSRRFTDERVRSVQELQELHRRVTAAHRRSPWGRNDAKDQVARAVVEQLVSQVELPSHRSFLEALEQCLQGLIDAETIVFEVPTLAPTPLSFREQAELNRRLLAQEAFLSRPPTDLLEGTLVGLAVTVIGSLPTLGSSSFSIPLISVVPDAPNLLDRLIGLVFRNEVLEAGLFRATVDQLYENLCTASGVSPDGKSAKPLVFPSDADLSLEECVAAYFGGTPLEALLLTPVPFDLPDEQRFSGHWIIAPAGRGKTTLLHAMLINDLERDASIIVMDSKGDLIEPLRTLRQIRDRLVIIDPDPVNPIGFNPLDVPAADISHAIDLMEYVFSSLLESKMTALQSTLFRSVLRALVTAVPNPTLETFRDILTNGYQPYSDAIKTLSPDLQDFFHKEFNTKIYEDRKKEIVWRLRLLLENAAIRSMLLAASTRFRIGEAMDAGKVIIINNSKSRLGEQGAEFFGRFFIAQVLAAAQQRSGRRPDQKKPCYFYIDECHTVIARDEKIPTILDECRSQRIALILAHQRTTQITSKDVLDALANCGVRYTNSDDEARTLAPKFRTTPELLQSLRRGMFAAFVRDLTPHAIVFKAEKVDFEQYPKLSVEDQALLSQRMQQLYGNVEPTTPPPRSAYPASTTPPRAEPLPPIREVVPPLKSNPAPEPPADWAEKW